MRRTQYRKLSKEQKDELDAAFQQNNFIDKVRYIDFPNSIVWFPIQSRRASPLLNELSSSVVDLLDVS